jgi:hypothetical protein
MKLYDFGRYSLVRRRRIRLEDCYSLLVIVEDSERERTR